MRAALLAGRAASRWASLTPTTSARPFLLTSTYAANPSRSFSSTRRVRQEAEASANYGGGMKDFLERKSQQPESQDQQQQQQPQASSSPPSQQSTVNANNNSIFLTPWADLGKKSTWNTPGKQIGVIQSPGDQVSELRKEELSPPVHDMKYFEDPNKRKLRLRPVVGRTIDFKTIRDFRAQDLASGLARLNIACNVNRVKNDFQRQRFHERPGLKRKRQKSERWVRRFKVGFQATCTRISKLAKQGW